FDRTSVQGKENELGQIFEFFFGGGGGGLKAFKVKDLAISFLILLRTRTPVQKFIKHTHEDINIRLFSVDHIKGTIDDTDIYFGGYFICIQSYITKKNSMALKQSGKAEKTKWKQMTLDLLYFHQSKGEKGIYDIFTEWNGDAATILESRPSDGGMYTLFAATVRGLMKEQGLKKETGCNIKWTGIALDKQAAGDRLKVKRSSLNKQYNQWLMELIFQIKKHAGENHVNREKNFHIICGYLLIDYLQM
ncbi:hypothetical protein ACJX0J_024503, partial [Zea mays]